MRVSPNARRLGPPIPLLFSAQMASRTLEDRAGITPANRLARSPSSGIYIRDRFYSRNINAFLLCRFSWRLWLWRRFRICSLDRPVNRLAVAKHAPCSCHETRLLRRSGVDCTARGDLDAKAVPAAGLAGFSLACWLSHSICPYLRPWLFLWPSVEPCH